MAAAHPTLGLADIALAIRDRGLDKDETRAAIRATVDWFAATIAGSVMPPALILAGALLGPDGSGPSRLVARSRTADVRTAALINATASHTAEMDDIYRDGIYHPGSPTLGAVVALAERLGSDGPTVLRAIAVGYEIGDRIAATVNPRHYRFWHTTGTVGTIGAAAGAAELLGLSRDRFAHALASATTMAAGLQQAFRSDAMSKPLHAGHAAEAGLLAALAASRGFTGALDVLDGPAGFGAAMGENLDWSVATADLDHPLRITEATVKNHSCCGHTFAAVDAALQLRSQGLRPSDVDTIEVRTYETAVKVAGNVDPKTEFEAKFSNSYCVAAALSLGTVRLRAFDASSLADPAIRRLAASTTVVGDAEMEKAFPGQRQAQVTVLTTDGRTLTAYRPTRKGDPDDPLTDAELADKFTDLSEPVLGPAGTEALGRALWDLADARTLHDVPFGRPVEATR